MIINIGEILIVVGIVITVYTIATLLAHKAVKNMVNRYYK